ncbi:MAG TPA: hypothetical protein VM938_11870 [Acidimicrobiales bacterium]|nr:hypothetical protein [Acidimicrobiales bacterium]
MTNYTFPLGGRTCNGQVDQTELSAARAFELAWGLGTATTRVAVARLLDSARGDGVVSEARLADLRTVAHARLADRDRMQLRLCFAEAADALVEAADGSGADVAVREFNRRVGRSVDIVVHEVCVTDRRLRATLPTRPPTAAVDQALRTWDASEPAPLAIDGLIVPLLMADKVVGVVRMTGRHQAEPDADVATAVGDTWCDLLQRIRRRHAATARQDRFVVEAHEAIAPQLAGLCRQLAEYAVAAPDRASRGRFEELLRVAAVGHRQVRQAGYALATVNARDGDVAVGLRRLVARFQRHSVLDVRFTRHGVQQPVEARVADTLLAVAHAALVNADAHGRARLATVKLDYRAEALTLHVRDDGIPFSGRRVLGSELGALVSRVRSLGGAMTLQGSTPRGAAVEVTLTYTIKGDC